MARHVPNGAELSFRCSSFPRPKLLVPTLCVGTRGADALRRAYPARVVRWVLPQRRRPRTQSVRCGRYDAERRNEGEEGEHEEMARHVPNGAELSFRCSSFPRRTFSLTSSFPRSAWEREGPTLCVVRTQRGWYAGSCYTPAAQDAERPMGALRTQSVRCGRYDAERRNEGTRGWLVVTRSGGRASTQPRLSSKA